MSDERKNPVTAELTDTSWRLANQFVQTLRNQQDVWWFVMTLFDWLQSSECERTRNLLQRSFPLKLHEIEYKWGKTEPFLAEIHNPGIDYLFDDAIPVISDKFGIKAAELVVTHAFSQYCLHNLSFIQEARHDFAVHFRDNLKLDGHLAIADQWDAVAHDIPSHGMHHRA